MVKFGRVSRARPHGRKVFGRCPFGRRKRGLSRCGFGVPFRVPWRPFGTPDGRFLRTLEAVLGRAEAVLGPPLHAKMHVLVCTLLESFCPPPPRRRECRGESCLPRSRQFFYTTDKNLSPIFIRQCRLRDSGAPSNARCL